MFPAPEFGCSVLILKNLEVNTNFTTVSKVPYWILNESVQSKCNSILGPRYLAVLELLISNVRSKPSNREEASVSAELQYRWAMWMKLHVCTRVRSTPFSKMLHEEELSTNWRLMVVFTTSPTCRLDSFSARNQPPLELSSVFRV
jgi:hypothetical protein